MINYGQPSHPGYTPLLPGLPRLPPSAKRAKKRIYWRDLLIYLARRHGLTYEFIAEAFAVSSNLVRTVLYRLAAFEEKNEDRRRRYLRVLPLPETALLCGAANSKRRARARRDLVIRLAHQHGFSQRALAEVFNLPRSWIATIIKAEGVDAARARVRNTPAEGAVAARAHREDPGSTPKAAR
jgi:hypothetical protein